MQGMLLVNKTANWKSRSFSQKKTPSRLYMPRIAAVGLGIATKIWRLQTILPKRDRKVQKLHWHVLVMEISVTGWGCSPAVHPRLMQVWGGAMLLRLFEIFFQKHTICKEEDSKTLCLMTAMAHMDMPNCENSTWPWRCEDANARYLSQPLSYIIASTSSSRIAPMPPHLKPHLSLASIVLWETLFKVIRSDLSPSPTSSKFSSTNSIKIYVL